MTTTDEPLAARIARLEAENDALRAAHAAREQELVEARERSERRFRSLFEDTPNAIGIARDGLTVKGNAALAQIFGYDDPAEVVGTSYMDHLAPEYREMVLQFELERRAGRRAS